MTEISRELICVIYGEKLDVPWMIYKFKLLIFFKFPETDF